MSEHPVAAMLKRRGFEVALCDPTRYLFFPPGLEKAVEDEIYSMLRKYSFRIFIRDVIKKRKAFSAGDLLKYTTREWVLNYLGFLSERGVIGETSPGVYRLETEAAFSFGDTLEWFAANIFERELLSPALWGVRLSNVKAGGDYDVISSVEGRLFYAEVKSSPPRNIEEAEVAAFIKRAEALSPSAAIFIEDTTLRMKDKIVPIFEGLLGERGLKVERLQDETFSIGERIFITNSAPDMITNIGYCVRRRIAPRGFWEQEEKIN